MRRFFVRWFLPKSNIHKQHNDQKKRIHEGYIIGKISKIYHLLFTFSLKTLASCKDRIPRVNLNVNIKISPIDLIGSKPGSINSIVNQAADRFTNNSENISSQARVEAFIYLRTIYPNFKIMSTRENQKTSGNSGYKLRKK